MNASAEVEEYKKAMRHPSAVGSSSKEFHYSSLLAPVPIQMMMIIRHFKFSNTKRDGKSFFHKIFLFLDTLQPLVFVNPERLKFTSFSHFIKSNGNFTPASTLHTLAKFAFEYKKVSKIWYLSFSAFFRLVNAFPMLPDFTYLFLYPHHSNEYFE